VYSGMWKTRRRWGKGLAACLDTAASPSLLMTRLARMLGSSRIRSLQGGSARVRDDDIDSICRNALASPDECTYDTTDGSVEMMSEKSSAARDVMRPLKLGALLIRPMSTSVSMGVRRCCLWLPSEAPWMCVPPWLWKASDSRLSSE
jgi:hypothetical protein